MAARAVPFVDVRSRGPVEIGPARGVLATSAGRGWRGIDAEHLRLPAYESPEVAAAGCSLALHLGRAVATKHRAGGQWRGELLVPGSVNLFSAGEPRQFRVPDGYECVVIQLDRELADGVSEAACGVRGVEHVGGVGLRDLEVERIALLLKAELKTGGLGGELYAQSLANALAVHLLREHSSLGEKAGREAAREPKPGGLPKPALRRATDYIGDNLGADLSLAEVAAAAGYSPHHFARMFRESTGLPPHRYVVRERAERAKHLLLGTETPLGEVARLCGFANQSHMGRHVKALLGATPARLRREARR